MSTHLGSTYINASTEKSRLSPSSPTSCHQLSPQSPNLKRNLYKGIIKPKRPKHHASNPRPILRQRDGATAILADMKVCLESAAYEEDLLSVTSALLQSRKKERRWADEREGEKAYSVNDDG
jgi:hypothetical protein